MEKISGLISKLYVFVMIASFLTIIGAIILQIIFRYILGSPLAWTEELSLFAFCWFTFSGAAGCSHEESHLEIDYFFKRIPGRMQIIADLIIRTIVIFLGSFLTLDALFTMSRQAGIHSISLRIPIPFYTLAIAAGFCGTVFFGLHHMAGKVMNLLSKGVE